MPQSRELVTGYGCSRKLETCTSLSRGQVSLCVSFFSYIPDHDNIHPLLMWVCVCLCAVMCVCVRVKSQFSVKPPPPILLIGRARQG